MPTREDPDEIQTGTAQLRRQDLGHQIGHQIPDFRVGANVAPPEEAREGGDGYSQGDGTAQQQAQSSKGHEFTPPGYAAPSQTPRVSHKRLPEARSLEA